MQTRVVVQSPLGQHLTQIYMHLQGNRLRTSTSVELTLAVAVFGPHSSRKKAPPSVTFFNLWILQEEDSHLFTLERTSLVSGQTMSSNT